MTVYNTKNTELVWRGITLSGFSSDKICIEQGSEMSTLLYVGISGEYFNCPNPKRFWTIKSTFLANSPSYKILEQDNLNHTEGTLIIRDINLDETIWFIDSTITTVDIRKDEQSRTVIWRACKRDNK